MGLNPIIIGIAGGTGSGKSTLADNIRKEFANNISMLSHDYYYKSHSDLSFDERKKLNFDHPDAFDTDLLIDHLKKLKKGETIYRPNYSFVDHLLLCINRTFNASDTRQMIIPAERRKNLGFK